MKPLLKTLQLKKAILSNGELLTTLVVQSVEIIIRIYNKFVIQIKARVFIVEID